MNRRKRRKSRPRKLRIMTRKRLKILTNLTRNSCRSLRKNLTLKLKRRRNNSWESRRKPRRNRSWSRNFAVKSMRLIKKQYRSSKRPTSRSDNCTSLSPSNLFIRSFSPLSGPLSISYWKWAFFPSQRRRTILKLHCKHGTTLLWCSS